MIKLEEKAKMVALEQTIKEAIRENKLVEKMDVIKLQVAELSIPQERMTELIAAIDASLQHETKLRKLVEKKKILISIVSILVVVVEWILGLKIATKEVIVTPMEQISVANFGALETSNMIHFSSVVWILVVNLVSLLVVVVAFSVAIAKSNRKKITS